MKKSHLAVRASAPVSFCVGLLVLTGCQKSSETNGPVTSPPPATVDVHNHPTEGPHHGGLIELGNEEYHAELVHDEAAETITIYVLDSAAKSAVPIEATSLLVNLSHDGQAEQFSLSASPQPNDPTGKSSRFTSTDAELAEEIDHEGVQAQLVVSISGKQYRGAIQHDHDHEVNGEDDNHADHDH